LKVTLSAITILIASVSLLAVRANVNVPITTNTVSRSGSPQPFSGYGTIVLSTGIATDGKNPVDVILSSTTGPVYLEKLLVDEASTKTLQGLDAGNIVIDSFAYSGPPSADCFPLTPGTSSYGGGFYSASGDLIQSMDATARGRALLVANSPPAALSMEAQYGIELFIFYNGCVNPLPTNGGIDVQAVVVAPSAATVTLQLSLRCVGC
jgi:hypothetical protein